MTAPVRCEVLVIGVGGMGAAALAHLARRGAKVVGVEQDEVPSERGSSVGETRVIRKAYYEDPRYVPLLARAYELWRELEAASGETLFVRTGCMTLGPPAHEAMRGVTESVTDHRLPHERLDAPAITARFPALVPAASDVGILEPDAGYLRVEACTRAHAQLAVSSGATLRTRVRVTSLSLTNGVRATLDDGATIEADKAVVSAGAWLPSLRVLDSAPFGRAESSPALRDVAAAFPLTVERQVQLWFARPAGGLPAFVHFVGDRIYYAIPTDESLKVCRHHGGSPAAPDTLDRAVHPADEETVRAYLRAHLPAVTGPVLRGRVCMYTNTPDQHFLVGALPAAPHVVVLGGFSGHGYKMATVMGEIAADLTLEGNTRHPIALFSPTRFSPPP